MKESYIFCIVTAVVCFIQPCSSQYDKDIHVGIILEGLDPTLPLILDKTLQMINRDRILTNRPQMIHHYQNVSQYDSFTASEKVCKMLEENNVVGIIGPESLSVSFFMDSLCTRFNVALVKSIPDFRMPSVDSDTQYLPRSVNVHPHPRSIGEAIASYIMDRKWIKSLIFVYETEEALFRLQDVLAIRNVEIETQQLDPSGDYKPQLKSIKKNQGFRILLDCSIENTLAFLSQAMEVKMLNEHYDYIIANWDFYAVDMRKFHNMFVNITSVQLVDTNNTKYSEIKKHMHSIESYMHGYLPFGVKTDHALFYDAVLVFSKAIDAIMRKNDRSTMTLYNPSLSCSNHAIRHNELPNAFRQLKDVEGLTGNVLFDELGARVQYRILILKFQKEVFLPVSVWSEDMGFRNLYSELEMQQQSDDILANKTFVVSTVKNTPFLIVKDNADELQGNDRYEGYVKDFLHEMSKILSATFIIQVVRDGKYGDNNTGGVWNGMVGEVIRQEADVVVADLTMTQKRSVAVDFTTPFMNLGIGILFKKPAKPDTSLFSFLDPFHSEVWIYMGTAYLGVSIVLFFLARLSPYEWDSGHPCEQEPEELELQFTLLNSFWFTIGSLMQQGCDFLPKLSPTEWDNPHPCNPEPDELENTFDPLNSFWFTIGSLMQQGSDLAPKAISTRIVASVWWFFTLIIVSSYTANLAAFLTSSRMKPPINSAKDLANQVKIKYGCVEGGSTCGFFSSSSNPTYQHMWNTMFDADPSVFVEGNKQGLERVRKGDYAFFMENIIIQYEIERDCDLMQVGQPLDNKGYGVAVKKGSPLLAKMNHAVLKMQEDGILNDLKKKWWTRPKDEGSCEGEKDADPTNDAKLGIENVGGVFLLLVLGSVLSGIVGFVEFLWHMHKTSVEDNVSLKEEIKHEMKFIMDCGTSTKPVNRMEADNDNENENGNAIPLQDFEET